MDATYTMIDGIFTNGNCEGWTRNDIEATAEAFGVSVMFDDITGRVYEVNGDERALIAEAE